MLTRIITEGKARLEIPEESLSSHKVFYNPRMRINRDITVVVTACFAEQEYTFLDALSASGIRGIRIAKEVGLNTTLCDWHELSYEFIKKNIKLNHLSNCTAIKRNANVVMLDHSYDIIDIDPFGSPAPFLDTACHSVKRLLCITATDTAPLCGAHRNAGIRRYASIPLKTEYYPEIGIRILLGAVARSLAKHDKAMIPLLSYVSIHYYRIFVAVKKNIKSADRCLEEMGFVSHCFNCSARQWKKGIAVHLEKKCPFCGKNTSPAGPLWLGRLHDKSFCEGLITEAKKRGFTQAEKLITACKDELNIPLYYDYHKLCKFLRISARPMNELISLLRSKRFQASRTHFSGVSFKTDASLEEIKNIIQLS